ncbi:MAG: hypothetical protein FWD61_14750 [Phycisphaerales bacterium]|nr:hypothetical protein [Phycisphaerales bacterium]
MEMIRAIQGSEVTWRLGWMLVHSLWIGAAVAAGLGVVLGMLRGLNARARYAVSCGAMLVLVAGMAGAYETR